MQVVFFVLVLLTACSRAPSELPLEAQACIVTFGSPALESAVRGALNKPTGDIRCYEMKALTSLDVSAPWYSGTIRSLEGLQYATALTELRLRFNKISDISQLSSLSRLRVLDLGYNQRIRNLRPLASLTRLEFLSLADNKITNLSPLQNLTKLENLQLGYNPITDVSALANLRQLESLSLNDTGLLSDISPLANLPLLQTLHLDSNAILDVSPLAGLSSLKTLTLSANGLVDVSSLATLSNLEGLSLAFNGVRNLRPLGQLRSLKRLSLEGNPQLRNLAPLQSLAQLEELTLARNTRISDYTPLRGISYIRCPNIKYTGFDDRATLVSIRGLKRNSYLFLYGHGHSLDLSPGSQDSQNLEQLRSRGVAVFENGQVTLECSNIW